jgi:3-oxoadipate enol-lactonase
MATLKTNGTEIYYQDHAAASGPAAPCVVLSAPAYFDSRFYQPLIEDLQRDFRVIAYDHRGHGRSAPLGRRADIESTTQDAVKLIEHLNAAPCHFVGNGLGAHVGLHIAIRRPDLVKSCVLMGAIAEAESDHRVREMDHSVDVLKHDGIKTGLQSLLHTYYSESFLTSSRPEDELCLKRTIELLLELTPHQIDNIKQVYHRPEISNAELRSISAPVMIVAGAEDSHARLVSYRHLAENIMNCTYETVAEAGYLVSLERPHEVLRLIRQQVENVDQVLGASTNRKSGFLNSKQVRS